MILDLVSAIQDPNEIFYNFTPPLHKGFKIYGA